MARSIENAYGQRAGVLGVLSELGDILRLLPERDAVIRGDLRARTENALSGHRAAAAAAGARDHHAGRLAIRVERELDEILRRPLRRHPRGAAGRDHLEAVPLAGERVDDGVKGGDRDGLEKHVIRARRFVGSRALRAERC